MNNVILKATLSAVFEANKSMKAISKMISKNFDIVATGVSDVFCLTLSSGETQPVRVIDDRFVVIGYSKPKGAKQTKIFLNKSTPVSSLKANKVVVIDLLESSVENGDEFDGFHLDEDNNVPVNFMLGGMKMVAVRNYISHNQLYVVNFAGDLVVTDNIKEMRSFVNGHIAQLMTAFSDDNKQSFASDIDVAIGL